MQTDSLTYAIDYIKTYMTSYVAGNQLDADFYACVFSTVFFIYATSMSLSIKYLYSAKSRMSNLRRWRVGD